MAGIKPVILIGQHVRLEPLDMDHLDALCAVGLDSAIWKWNTHPVKDRNDMRGYIQTALVGQSKGQMLPFVTIEQSSDTIVGSTRYGAINMRHKRVEIGWTWLNPKWQRTGINTEAKLLMLRHAFDTLDCNRVEWKTDSNNEQSKAAILRLGAQFEGTHRAHMQREDGTLRDTVFYSVIREEWPGIENHLVEKLKR